MPPSKGEVAAIIEQCFWGKAKTDCVPRDTKLLVKAKRGFAGQIGAGKARAPVFLYVLYH